MKIGQSTDIPSALISGSTQQAPATAAKTGQSAVATASNNASSAGVAVTVSTLARALEKTQGGDSAEIDTAKVNAIRTSIADGSYVVNPEAIADKLLANAKEMLDGTRN